MELYYGVVHGNRVELENGARLAEGVRVEVRPQSPEATSRDDQRAATNLRAAEDALKDRLRTTGRLAPVAAEDTGGEPDVRRRIQVTGEPLSEQIIRERR